MFLKSFITIFLVALIMFIPTSVLSAELSVIFTAPGDDGDIGTAAEYLVFYSTTLFDSTNVDSLVENNVVDTAHFCAVPNLAGTSEQCTLTGLLSDTAYWVAIKTADEVPNWSELSNVITATTLDVIPPARITDLRVE